MKRIGVIGSGTMGGGLAQKIATEGYHVTLVESTQESLQRGMKRIESSLDEAIQKKIMKPEGKAKVLSRLKPTIDYADLSGTELVIEAVFEDLQVKREVFKKIAAATGPKTIIATNTSSYRVEELASITPHPERVIGLHYFYHPAKNKMVEIIGTPQTPPEVMSLAWSFNLSLGKTPIICADAYGFVVNRYFVPFVNEATRILQEKRATLEEIEVVAKEVFGIGMGPFELMNVTGVPISFHATTTLGRAFKSFYTPCTLLASQVESKQNWSIGPTPTAISEDKKNLITDHLLGLTFTVVGQLMDENVCSIEDCDIGARVALTWKKGPFQLMNEVGADRAKRMVENFCSQNKVTPPRYLKTFFDSKKKWNFAPLEVKRVSKTAHIVLKRPEAMNPLSPDLLESLHKALNEIEQDSKIECIHLESIGKAFVAGADLKFMLGLITKGDAGGMKEFISFGSKVFSQLDHSKKLVIAKVHGPSYGGGTEIALTSDTLILGDKAFMCLPETGLGLLPGLGGTQRILRFASNGLAKLLVYTGLPISGSAAVTMGLAEYGCTLAEMESVAAGAALNANRLTKMKREAAVISSEFAKAIRLFERHNVKTLLDPKFSLDTESAADPLCQKAVEALKTKSPYALLLSEEAIDVGGRIQKLDEALNLERELFFKLTQHPDAIEGIKAFMEKRPARFAPLS